MRRVRTTYIEIKGFAASKRQNIWEKMEFWLVAWFWKVLFPVVLSTCQLAVIKQDFSDKLTQNTQQQRDLVQDTKTKMCASQGCGPAEGIICT